MPLSIEKIEQRLHQCKSKHLTQLFLKALKNCPFEITDEEALDQLIRKVTGKAFTRWVSLILCSGDLSWLKQFLTNHPHKIPLTALYEIIGTGSEECLAFILDYLPQESAPIQFLYKNGFDNYVPRSRELAFFSCLKIILFHSKHGKYFLSSENSNCDSAIIFIARQIAAKEKNESAIYESCMVQLLANFSPAVLQKSSFVVTIKQILNQRWPNIVEQVRILNHNAATLLETPDSISTSTSTSTQGLKRKIEAHEPSSINTNSSKQSELHHLRQENSELKRRLTAVKAAISGQEKLIHELTTKNHDYRALPEVREINRASIQVLIEWRKKQSIHSTSILPHQEAEQNEDNLSDNFKLPI